jgi:hypothetical protein
VAEDSVRFGTLYGCECPNYVFRDVKCLVKGKAIPVQP